jgi:CO dehydrogenase/acetyl-CoA synthase gamma subunit (corrinoid Fe-S protein)
VLATDKETPVRRLYRKWKLQGTPLIAREQDRLNHEKAKTVAASNFLDNIYLIQNSRAATKFMKAAQDFSESPMAIALEKAANSPLMRAITEFANSPLMKVIAESANSPGMIAAKQLASSARVQSVLEAGMQIKNLLELENNKSLWAKNLSETEQSLQALQGA